MNYRISLLNRFSLSLFFGLLFFSIVRGQDYEFIHNMKTGGGDNAFVLWQDDIILTFRYENGRVVTWIRDNGEVIDILESTALFSVGKFYKKSDSHINFIIHKANEAMYSVDFFEDTYTIDTLPLKSNQFIGEAAQINALKVKENLWAVSSVGGGDVLYLINREGLISKFVHNNGVYLHVDNQNNLYVYDNYRIHLFNDGSFIPKGWTNSLEYPKAFSFKNRNYLMDNNKIIEYDALYSKAIDSLVFDKEIPKHRYEADSLILYVDHETNMITKIDLQNMSISSESFSYPLTAWVTQLKTWTDSTYIFSSKIYNIEAEMGNAYLREIQLNKEGNYERVDLELLDFSMEYISTDTIVGETPYGFDSMRTFLVKCSFRNNGLDSIKKCRVFFGPREQYHQSDLFLELDSTLHPLETKYFETEISMVGWPNYLRAYLPGSDYKFNEKSNTVLYVDLTPVSTIDEPAMDEFQVVVSPNPVMSDVLTLNANTPITSIRVFDASGQLMYFSKTDTQIERLEVSQYSPGIYYIVVSNDDFLMKTLKFIKL